MTRLWIDTGPGNDPTCFDHQGYHLIGGRGGDRDYAMRLEHT